jgi:hypothetical protein
VQLVSIDDKHKIKCGEPSFPLTAAERGKKVIVGINQTMAVGDHDFSKCTLTQLVNILVGSCAHMKSLVSSSSTNAT